MNTTSSIGRGLRRIVSFVFVPLLALGPAAPASAETDSLSNQCLYVGGVERACAYSLYVTWGSGISWQAGGRLVDERGDSWYNTVEIRLNRQWASNTSWIQVLRAADWQTHTWSVSGSDPTYGAWVRLCSVGAPGSKYCTEPRYVKDNS